MKKFSTRLILVAATAIYNNPSCAGLVVSPDDSYLGNYCFSECKSSNCPRLFVCHCQTPYTCDSTFNNMPKCTSNSLFRHECLVGKDGTDDDFQGYFCAASDSDACEYCGLPSRPPREWKTFDNAKHVVQLDLSAFELVDDEMFYNCDGGINMDYGCAAGYYTTSNYYWGGMTCIACPEGGTNNDGDSAIASCYIPSGGEFSDETGSGTVTGKCYYQK